MNRFLHSASVIAFAAMWLSNPVGPVLADEDPEISGNSSGRYVEIEGRASQRGQQPASVGQQPSSGAQQVVVDSAVCVTGQGPASECGAPVGCGDENVLYARSSFLQLAPDARRQLDDLEMVCRRPTQADIRELVTAEFYRHAPQTPAPATFPSSTTLCNLDTVYWSTAGSYSIGTTILGQLVTIFLTPTSWVFDLGEATKRHATAGRPDSTGEAVQLRRRQLEPARSGFYTFRYAKTTDTSNNANPHQLTSTVTYTATYSIGGGVQETITGTITGTSPATPLTVKQARAQLVDGG